MSETQAQAAQTESPGSAHVSGLAFWRCVWELVRFRPWLQAFRDYAFDRRHFKAKEVSAQIDAARDFGSNGYMLWNASNRYTDAGVPRLDVPSIADQADSEVKPSSTSEVSPSDT